jgi:hypothetical protein
VSVPSVADTLAVDESRLDRFDELNDWVLLPAAIAVIPVILIEQSHASESWKAAAGVANWVIWLLFAAEAIVMLGLSPARRRWAREHKLELAVVVLTPPVLPPGLQSLRVLRLMRLLRLAAGSSCHVACTRRSSPVRPSSPAGTHSRAWSKRRRARVCGGRS